jgi:integral membrane sensor domain MASE1
MTTRSTVMRQLETFAPAVLFGVLAYLSSAYTRGHTGVAAVWLPNAVLVALLLRGERQQASVIGFAFLANALANLAAGDPLMRSVGLSAVNTVEIIVAVLGMVRLGFTRPDMLRLKDVVAFALIGGLAAPIVSGALATRVLAPAGDVMLRRWLEWAMTDSLGMLIVAPANWVGLEAWQRRERPDRRIVGEWAAVLGGGMTVIVAVFAQSSYPLLYLVTPVLLLAAFRLGALGATVATVLTAIIAMVATGLDSGPMALIHGELTEKLYVLQSFLAVNFVMSLPVASSLAQRDSKTASLAQSEARFRGMAEAAPAGEAEQPDQRGA